jgi:hypothetical protein
MNSTKKSHKKLLFNNTVVGSKSNLFLVNYIKSNCLGKLNQTGLKLIVLDLWPWKKGFTNVAAARFKGALKM